MIEPESEGRINVISLLGSTKFTLDDIQMDPRTDFESTGPDEDPFLLRSLSSLLITNVYFGTAHTGFNLRSQTREAGNVLRRALWNYYKLEDRLEGAREMQSFGYAEFKHECLRRYRAPRGCHTTAASPRPLRPDHVVFPL